MIKIMIWCIKSCMAVIISMVLLSLFTLMYSYSGVHVQNETGATDYKWEANQFRSTMQEGFSWLHMNADGFNNSFNLAETDHIDILLMGSSHMEAVNVPLNTNVGYLLNNKYASGYITYNIGMSGHTIYHCVNNLKNAIEYYNPSRYIIIETDRIELDEQKMLEVIEDKFPRIPSHDTGIKYHIQKYIPCFLPLYRELGNWKSAGENPTKKHLNNKESDTEQLKYKTLLNRFMQRIVEGADGKKVIILYHPETRLLSSGLFEEENLEPKEIFEAACLEHGIKFVDMNDDFREEFKDRHKLAHGFINTGIGEGHLNEIGHSLIARRLGGVIKELDNGIK